MEHFKVYQSQTKFDKIADSLNHLVGEGGTFRPSSRKNFLSERSVALTCTRANGTSTIVVVAQDVSQQLRDKSLKLSELGTFPIFEFGNPNEVDEETGKPVPPMLLLAYPSDGNSDVPTVTVTKDIIAKAKDVKLKRQASFDWTSRMAY